MVSEGQWTEGTVSIKDMPASPPCRSCYWYASHPAFDGGQPVCTWIYDGPVDDIIDSDDDTTFCFQYMNEEKNYAKAEEVLEVA